MSRKVIQSFCILFFFLLSIIVLPLIPQVQADSYDGSDLARAILADPTTLLSSSYSDTDRWGNRQSIVLSSLGAMQPTNGSTFALISTGTAGANPVTSNEENPGSERGTWFGRKYPGWWGRYDRVDFTMDLHVPDGMHYLYYDVKFFSTEYPEYVGAGYNDKFTITVVSPSEGRTSYNIDVDSGDFILNANDIPGTGFDVFATTGDPDGVDQVTNTSGPGPDSGATAYVTRQHPVSPDEDITITFSIKDTGDNQFDSAAFIDYVMFSGYGIANLRAQKTYEDLNGGSVEAGDTLKYTITINNIGRVDQPDNPGNEFEDVIPTNTTYEQNSATASSGTIMYDSMQEKIIWNGGIPGESSVRITFNVTIDPNLSDFTTLSNQGIIYWDSTEDGSNNAQELTDDPDVDDGIDQDNDGETGDDDPTNTTVHVYNFTTLTENFSDDTPGSHATQSYYGLQWFNSSFSSSLISEFAVAPNYYYATPQSFKTQLRANSGIHYWNYTFYDTPTWWTINFTCGNNSEDGDIYLDFQTGQSESITQLKFDYTQNGANPAMDWVAELYYLDKTGWNKLHSNYSNGYLFNDWYSIRINHINSTNLTFQLIQKNIGLVSEKQGVQLAPFGNLTKIIWSSTRNSVVCPMFFWDEHTVGFT